VLLNQLYKEAYKGGNIKGPNEEEWLYRANGLLKNTESSGISKNQSFSWDGETLRAKYKNSFGYGVWDGVSMRWYQSEEAFTSHPDEPLLVYYWDPLTREYHQALRDPKQTWKWTRHFLARKEGRGEWIMEGNVPEPVIMFLQLLRQTQSPDEQRKDLGDLFEQASSASSYQSDDDDASRGRQSRSEPATPSNLLRSTTDTEDEADC
jgi:hypothetical protein